MKTIILLRHSKASHDVEFVDDISRPLTARGISEALIAGDRIKSLKSEIQYILTSYALRCYQTSLLIMQCAGLNPECLHVSHVLYDTNENILENEIRKIHHTIDCIMICNHNPLLENIMQTINRDSNFRFGTSDIAILSFKEKSWRNFAISKMKLQS